MTMGRGEGDDGKAIRKVDTYEEAKEEEKQPRTLVSSLLVPLMCWTSLKMICWILLRILLCLGFFIFIRSLDNI